VTKTPICESCGQNPGTVHLTEIVKRWKSVTRLCEECALKRGAPVTLKERPQTHTPEQLEAYRQEINDDTYDDGHIAVVFLDALDTILTLRQEDSDLNAANVKLGTDLLEAWAQRDELRAAFSAVHTCGDDCLEGCCYL